MNYQLLSSLVLNQKPSKIRVRVTNTWTSSGPRWSTFHCILIDETGACIEASARHDDLELFTSLLQEDLIYELSGFKVIPNRKNFRTVPTECMIRLDRATSVLNISSNNVSIPMRKFVFEPFHKLETLIHKDENLTDVIGQVISVGSLQGTTEHERKSLLIRDLNKIEVLVTLWGKHAIYFDENAILGHVDPVIIIFAGMTVRTWEGRICLSSSFATRYYINADIPEVFTFLEGITDAIIINKIATEQSIALGEATDQSPKNVTTIADLLTVDPSKSLNKKFLCKANIINIESSRGWFYRACPRCKLALQTYRSTVWCNRCSQTDITPIPWYKLSIVVQDHTGEANFIMFGKLVQDLIQIPVSNLANHHSSDKYSLPPVFNKIVGKEYVFTVLPNNRSTQRTNDDFKVITINIASENAAATPAKELETAATSSKAPLFKTVLSTPPSSKQTGARRQLFLEQSPPKQLTDQAGDISIIKPSSCSTLTALDMPRIPSELDKQEDPPQPLQNKPRSVTIKKEKRD